MQVGFWSVIGDWNGTKCATGWDRYGFESDGNALLADFISANGEDLGGWKNVHLVRQCDAAAMVVAPITEPLFRDVNLPLMPKEED